MVEEVAKYREQVVERVIELDDELMERYLGGEEISPEEALRELPFPAPAVRMLLDAWAAALGQPAYVTSTVAEVTGRPARRFRDWVTDHVEEFRS